MKEPRCIYDQKVFAEVCARAAADPAFFSRFKSDPYFTLVWENRTQEEGQAWFDKVQNDYPQVLAGIHAVDEIGSPRVYSYAETMFSPSTLRLAAMAGDIHARIGSMEQSKVIQIGAGQGTLCKILHALGPIGEYTIVDLPEQLVLAQKCLEALDIRGVRFLAPEELPQNASYDLAVSDGAFSEFNRSFQKLFIDRILSRARCGYLAGRVFPKHYGVIAMNPEELKKRLKKDSFSVWEMAEPTLEKEEYSIYWK